MILLNIQRPLFLAGLALLSALLSNYAQSQYTTRLMRQYFPVSISHWSSEQRYISGLGEAFFEPEWPWF